MRRASLPKLRLSWSGSRPGPHRSLTRTKIQDNVEHGEHYAAVSYNVSPSPLKRGTMSETSDSAARNVVLVHGGFVDGSGWEAVYRILRKDGFKVSVVQNPTTS